MTMGPTLAALAASVVALFSMGLLAGTAARADEIQMTPLIVDVLVVDTSGFAACSAAGRAPAGHAANTGWIR
jgi:hypothetical protein